MKRSNLPLTDIENRRFPALLHIILRSIIGKLPQKHTQSNYRTVFTTPWVPTSSSDGLFLLCGQACHLPLCIVWRQFVCLSLLPGLILLFHQSWEYSHMYCGRGHTTCWILTNYELYILTTMSVWDSYD